MSQSHNFGSLKAVDVRQHWVHESSDFTPWLARVENISLLGEAIGMDLEPLAVEERIGPFRADIVCQDSATRAKVLIENQLECTDHCHLGQLMTYAAGLDAVSVVWIATRFTEEHRAALDWLNRVTHDSLNFFGLEIELWRIGNSPPAPKFNVVCKPNGWSKSVAESELSGTDALYQSYWTGFKAFLESSAAQQRLKSAPAQSWVLVPVGRSEFTIAISVSVQKRTGSVALVIYEPDRLANFDALQQQQDAIHAEVGQVCEWRRMEEKQESQIRVSFSDFDPGNRADWPRQHAFLARTVSLFSKCFRPKVASLDEVRAKGPDRADSTLGDRMSPIGEVWTKTAEG
jgi:hypothetical protein